MSNIIPQANVISERKGVITLYTNGTLMIPWAGSMLTKRL
jgi:hypothetical protein